MLHASRPWSRVPAHLAESDLTGLAQGICMAGGSDSGVRAVDPASPTRHEPRNACPSRMRDANRVCSAMPRGHAARWSTHVREAPRACCTAVDSRAGSPEGMLHGGRLACGKPRGHAARWSTRVREAPRAYRMESGSHTGRQSHDPVAVAVSRGGAVPLAARSARPPARGSTLSTSTRRRARRRAARAFLPRAAPCRCPGPRRAACAGGGGWRGWPRSGA
jgi:hypothetical protein